VAAADSLEAFAGNPSLNRSAHVGGTTVKLDAFGLPIKELERLLMNHQVFQVRTILSRTSRHAGDDDARQIWLAACYAVEQRFEEAVDGFSKVKNMDSASSSYALYLAAWSYSQMQDFTKAIELATLAIKRGNYYQSYELRGGCYNAEKHYVEAASDYEKAATLMPNRAGGLYSEAANALLRANKPAEALVLANKAPEGTKGDGGDVPMRLTRALCYEKLNRWSDAVPQLTKGLAIARLQMSKHQNYSNLSFSRCMEERAKCYEKLGKKAEATADRKELETWSKGMVQDWVGK
jgi:tetratricopeptide (TPR) repeat protein